MAPYPVKLVGWQLDGTPIHEERLPDFCHRVYRGDPRYCPLRQPHPPHYHDYWYLRKLEHGGLTRGHYLCDGRTNW